MQVLGALSCRTQSPELQLACHRGKKELYSAPFRTASWSVLTWHMRYIPTTATSMTQSMLRSFRRALSSSTTRTRSMQQIPSPQLFSGELPYLQRRHWPGMQCHGCHCICTQSVTHTKGPVPLRAISHQFLLSNLSSKAPSLKAQLCWQYICPIKTQHGHQRERDASPVCNAREERACPAGNWLTSTAFPLRSLLSGMTCCADRCRELAGKHNISTQKLVVRNDMLCRSMQGTG